MKRIFMMLLLLFVGTAAALSASAQRGSLVGNLRTHAGNGCGCYFGRSQADLKANRLIFFASDEATDIWMNIDGKDVKLTRTSHTDPKGKIRVGSKYITRYTSGDITVDLVRTATWVCPPRDESCEVTKFSAVFTIHKGKRKQVVRSVGECGC